MKGNSVVHKLIDAHEKLLWKANKISSHLSIFLCCCLVNFNQVRHYNKWRKLRWNFLFTTWCRNPQDFTWVLRSDSVSVIVTGRWIPEVLWKRNASFLMPEESPPRQMWGRVTRGCYMGAEPTGAERCPELASRFFLLIGRLQ
jgi:hypothetical protein